MARKQQQQQQKVAVGETVGLADPELTALKKTHPRYSRKAAIFGIDKYMIEGADLSGCANDAYDFADTLWSLGWPKSGVHIIVNEQATTDRWYKEMEWLTKDTGPGDIRIYAQSPHGSNKFDYSGDEPDRRDEMPIFHNFDWDNESTHIVDDDIRENYTKKLHKEAFGDVVLDTCFSGTGARSLFRASMATQARYLRNPYQQPVLNRFAWDPNQSRKWFGNSNVDREIAGETTENNGTLYACRDDQVAYETAVQVNGVWIVRGLMTYNLCNILRETRGDISRRDLGQELAARVANESDQIPGYECTNEQYYNQYPFRRGHQNEPGEIKI